MNDRNTSAVPHHPQSEIYLGQYLVCFVDLLNQSNRLKELSPLPEDAGNNPRFIDAVNDTIGNVLYFRKEMNEFVQGLKQLGHLPIPKDASPEQLERLALHRAVLTTTQQFADTTLLYYPLPAEPSHGVKSLYGTVVGIGLIHINMLANQIAMRGGIDIDVGTDALPGQVYGPVLSNAYNLEQKVARYPRIVFGNGYVNWVKSLAESKGDRAEDGICRDVGMSLGRLTVQTDDAYMLHFLGPEIKKFADAIPLLDYRLLVKRARQFVESSKAKFEDSGPPELFGRYTQLLKYFDENDWRWA